jgi:DNA adenine methylase
MPKLTPQEKKQLSYAHDRRNVYGQNSKASRRAIPRKKRKKNRAYRKATNQILLKNQSIAVVADDVDKRIEAASMTITEWKRQREILRRASEFSELEIGFSLFFLNRCNRSGIPNAGVIGGLEQSGKWKMDARFPRSDLIHRIELIALKKQSIKVYKQDAEEFIKKQIPKTPRDTLVYCDPPYFNKASRLYLDHYRPEDHKDLADVIQTKLKRPWIVSYDSVPEIVGFYAERTHFTYDLQYNAAKAYKGKEVFVFSDKVKVPPSSSIAAINLAIKGCALV